MSLEARLKRIEQRPQLTVKKVYMFSYGAGSQYDFQSKEEFEEEIKKPKYENATVILDLWRGGE